MLAEKYRRIYRWKPGSAPKRPPATAYRTVSGPDNQFCRVSNRPWKRYLGPDAARARNRHSVSAARGAGYGGIGKDAGSSGFEGSGAAPGGWTRHNREY